jgi:hypothetical protein
MTEESRRIRGEDAKALLSNTLLRGAFDAVGEHLEAQALSCDPDNKDKAARIVIAKQILAGIEREIKRVIEDGEVAEIQLVEIERKKSLMQRVKLFR